MGIRTVGEPVAEDRGDASCNNGVDVVRVESIDQNIDDCRPITRPRHTQER
jgi:hypothetical protein